MTTTDHPLVTASRQFRAVAAMVRDDQWDLPTPCPDWNVTEVLGHVIAGSQMSAAIAAGAGRAEAIDLLSTQFISGDPLAALDVALALQEAALVDSAVDDRVCQHPAGDMPGAQLRSFRMSDLLVHQWDLARAIGVNDTLNSDVVQIVWDDISPMAPVIAQLGVFGNGPSGTVPDHAPLHERLLDLMGRRP
ncbi:TIGR03086 family metal-binding protein [Ilumatobacter sp.]|uniref:TIGR03086 family metal-binding protein n=1 Tax=Ilumatobacter sp. TaxID=1967498 RepID=UPI003750C8E1